MRPRTGIYRILLTQKDYGECDSDDDDDDDGGGVVVMMVMMVIICVAIKTLQKSFELGRNIELLSESKLDLGFDLETLKIRTFISRPRPWTRMSRSTPRHWTRDLRTRPRLRQC